MESEMKPEGYIRLLYDTSCLLRHKLYTRRFSWKDSGYPSLELWHLYINSIHFATFLLSSSFTDFFYPESVLKSPNKPFGR